jgi:hypothetical protein
MRLVAPSFVLAALSLVAILMVAWPDYETGDDLESELLLGWFVSGIGAVVLAALRWRLLLARAALVVGACSLIAGLVLFSRTS